ncbi:SDR family oxidoreductase [Ferrimonas marina]|uniref:3-oxoacyl-[acyl-carrier protein] reductase n=1 Tax=Ferrimonas marina TaxID=299255 RepID=A0A1M5Z9W5_9GAMM|nr:SDR family NAD(P)-dependent oxidoreductase [Ferrimonas marina]SHI21021.1 3-oxoacyl-[acyl-carrier protein] reductase [Ferrimonas marina]
MNKKESILITGGQGDLAVALASQLKDRFEVYKPSREELDVSSPESVSEYFSDKEFDVVVNLAGCLYSARVLESEEDKWIRDINVNLIGTYLVCRNTLRKNSKARLVNVSSTASFNHYPDWTSYCSSKAGVNKLSLGLALDGYNVTIMCPGAIDTKLRDGLSINNPNVMTVEEGIAPIMEAIDGKYQTGDIVFYRKGEMKIIPIS